MATKKSGGSTRNGRDSAGRRLGVKKFGGESVHSSMVIIRQRGTKYYPGVNTYMGKDHTIHCSGSDRVGQVSYRKSYGKVYVDVKYN